MVTVMEHLDGVSDGLKGRERVPYSEERVSQHTVLILNKCSRRVE